MATTFAFTCVRLKSVEFPAELAKSGTAGSRADAPYVRADAACRKGRLTHASRRAPGPCDSLWHHRSQLSSFPPPRAPRGRCPIGRPVPVRSHAWSRAGTGAEGSSREDNEDGKPRLVPANEAHWIRQEGIRSSPPPPGLLS
jgi:hypothetical protein